MYRIFYLSFIILLNPTGILFCQTPNEDPFAELEQMMAETDKEKTNYVTATFKSTRVINGQSVENLSEGTLDFRILHRFGTLNRGWYELWGLDNASMRMSFDYGLKDWLMVGVGRSTFQKQYDGMVKARILRQSTGKRNMPITLSWMSNVMLQTLKWADPTRENFFRSRLFYTHQVVAGRKFSEALSLQLMPTVVHFNLVERASDPNDLYSLGVGGRLKLNKRVSVNGEYFYQINRLANTYNTLSIGFDIETGGHVFQLHVTNATGMTERTFITQNTNRWSKGDILFGFNLSRSFTLKDNRKVRKVQ